MMAKHSLSEADHLSSVVVSFWLAYCTTRSTPSSSICANIAPMVWALASV